MIHFQHLFGQCTFEEVFPHLHKICRCTRIRNALHSSTYIICNANCNLYTTVHITVHLYRYIFQGLHNNSFYNQFAFRRVVETSACDFFFQSLEMRTCHQCIPKAKIRQCYRTKKPFPHSQAYHRLRIPNCSARKYRP